MNIPPLAIVQARMGSKRLPGKVLLPIGGKSILERVWQAGVSAFGIDNVVVAYPRSHENKPIHDEVKRLGALGFDWDGSENDVLGRFYHCAHQYRWHPESVIIRLTCDDPFKQPYLLRQTANGVRFDPHRGGEGFTLAQLDAAQARYPQQPQTLSSPPPNPREHLTYAFFPTLPPEPPPGKVWTVDTRADYERACQQADAA